MLTFVAAVRLNPGETVHYDPPTVHTIIAASKSPAIINTQKFFMIEDWLEASAEYGEPFSVSLFLKVSKLHSVILSTIAMNFADYTSDPNISLLSVDEMKLLLKSKILQVRSEDQVVDALMLWGRSNRLHELEALADSINWHWVSNIKLLYAMEIWRESPAITEIVQKNVYFRLEFPNFFAMWQDNQGPIPDNLKISEARHCYKQSQVQLGDNTDDFATK